MNAGWKIFWLGAAVFGIAFGVERLLVPDVVPVGFADESRPLWTLETAFVLRATELMAAGVALISLVIMLGVWIRTLPRRGTP